jgi:hypothetical protein
MVNYGVSSMSVAVEPCVVRDLDLCRMDALVHYVSSDSGMGTLF